MDTKPFNEWIIENPGKNINDYYKLYGKPIISNPNIDQHNMVEPKSPNRIISPIVSIRIAPWRLFLYTGIVMGSTVLWVIIFWLVIIMLFGGHTLREILTKLLGG